MQKSDSNQLSLATASILGQPPSSMAWGFLAIDRFQSVPLWINHLPV
jgi:hypothetical protein